ncbi:MAG: chorismate mutase [Candidatus Nanopelagicaceae bacterium]
MSLRAIRGAIQVEANSAQAIESGVKELLPAILQANSIDRDAVISVIMTCTPDLNAAFPAAFAREIGFGAIPLLCAVEMDVPGALALVIRVLLHAELTQPANHVYLRGATVLRKDLAQ